MALLALSVALEALAEALLAEFVADVAALDSEVDAADSLAAAADSEAAAAAALAAASAEVPTHHVGRLAGSVGSLPWLAACCEVYKTPSVPTAFWLSAYVAVEIQAKFNGTHQAV